MAASRASIGLEQQHIMLRAAFGLIEVMALS